MKMKKAGAMEIALIAVFVAVTTVAIWIKFSPTIRGLVGMSYIHNVSGNNGNAGNGNNGNNGNNSGIVNPPANNQTLEEKLQAALDALMKDPNNKTKRVETAGILSQMIAQYKQTKDSTTYNTLSKSLKELASTESKDMSDKQVAACVADPSYCAILK